MTAQTPGTGTQSGANQSPATEQAKNAAGTAAEEGKHVAGVAADEVKQVASDVKDQARDLLGELRTQVSDQASTQRDRIVEALHEFTDELDSMTQSGGGSGVATEMVRQVSKKANSLCSMMEDREPSDLLDEVRRMARRKPSTFLFGAVAAGVLAGRVTRGAKKANSSSTSDSTSLATYGNASVPATAPPVAVPTSPAPTGYPGGGTSAATSPVREVPPVGGPTSIDPVEPGLSPQAYPGDPRTTGGNP